MSATAVDSSISAIAESIAEEAPVAAIVGAEDLQLISLSAAASALMKAWVKGDQQAFEQLAASDFQLRMPGVGVEAQGLSAGGWV